MHQGKEPDNVVGSDEYPMCFACGKENPISLGLEYEFKEGLARAEFVPRDVHQGYQGIMHGGLVTTLLDETMVKAVGFQGIEAVTGEIRVRFKKPVVIDRPLVIYGKVEQQKRRLFLAKSWIEDEEGLILVEGSAKFMAV